MSSRYDAIRDKLPTPRGEQIRVLALNHAGHHVILGTAGSGKTTMAILRALSLADSRLLHAGPTLLVTYNKTLVQFLQKVVADGDHLEVRTFHRFALGYLTSQKLDMNQAIVGGNAEPGLVSAALLDVRKQRNELVLGRPSSYFQTELQWIGRHGVSTLEEYLKVDRVGRRQSLSPRQRPAVWAVRERYLQLRAEDGYSFDWNDLASEVVAQFGEDQRERRYLHIVVDEAQDFSLEMLRALVAAVRPGGSLTLFGDAAQQIYGRGVSWRSAGINVQKIWEFERNYRNSRPIVALAAGIAAMPYFSDVEDLVQPSDEVDEGPTPALVTFDSHVDEWAWIVERAQALGAIASTGVIFRRGSDVDHFLQLCPSAKRLDRHTRAWDERPAIWASTAHSAKGFEFQSVIIPRLNRHVWPEPMAVVADEEDAISNDGRLLYVAVTRCRQNLILTHAGERTELLPDQPELWTESRR